MDFEKYLQRVAKQLDKEVDKILKQQIELAGKTDKKLVPLLKAFSKTCQGGKRIRGVLVLLGYQLGPSFWQARNERVQNLDSGVVASAPPQNNILKVAAAYEICHAAILAHDDIIDQSILRRDKLSLYQALGGNHYGVSQAISLADYGFFLAFKIIAKTKAVELFSQVMMDTTWGEMLDLEKADPQVVMKLKTACYTISGPLQIGAILAGLGPTSPRLRRIKEFGENLGIAYQMQDDILDSEADYLGGVEKAEKDAKEYINKSMKIIPSITRNPGMSKLLEQMAGYLVERKK